MDNREAYVDKIVDRGLEKPKCVSLENLYTHYTWRKYWKNWKCPQVVHSKTEVIHKVIHRLWIMLITVTRYRVESAKIELVFVRVRRTVWISCG